jgi:hypothetical protein
MIGSHCVAATMTSTDGQGTKDPRPAGAKLFTIGCSQEIFFVKGLNCLKLP